MFIRIDTLEPTAHRFLFVLTIQLLINSYAVHIVRTQSLHIICIRLKHVALLVRRLHKPRKVGRIIVDQHTVLLVHAARKLVPTATTLVHEDRGKILIRPYRRRRVRNIAVTHPLVQWLFWMEDDAVERIPIVLHGRHELEAVQVLVDGQHAPYVGHAERTDVFPGQAETVEVSGHRFAGQNVDDVLRCPAEQFAVAKVCA